MMEPETPPKTAPYFFDPYNEEGDDPHRASAFLMGQLVSAVRISPDWFVDDDANPTPFSLNVIEHRQNERALIGFSGGGVTGQIELKTDPSGYLLAVGYLDGKAVFRGYIDQPYEERDIWPPGAEFDPRRTVDAPGRIGKRGTWIVVNTKVWPAFAPVANEVGYFLAQARD